MKYKKTLITISLICSLSVNAQHNIFTAGFEPHVISDLTGNIAHGATVILTASTTGFGDKGTAQAAPALWDDASGADVYDIWDGGWPSNSGESSPRYAASGSIGGVETAHSHVSHYLVTRAYDNETGTGGFTKNNMVWKVLPADIPEYIYVSWYRRVHPEYDPGDNFKIFDYSGGTSPYDFTGNWYISHNVGFEGGYIYNDAGAGMSFKTCNGYYGSDIFCNSLYLGDTTDITSLWAKMEVIIYVTDQIDGWFDVYDNGVHKINRDPGGRNGTGAHSYNGATDSTITSLSRNIGIGGFNRQEGINNWRFFNDLYIDYTLARVVIGNNPSYNNSTVREIQIPQSWTNESITFTVNQATFTAGETAYLFVIGSNGQASVGYPITIGL